MPTNLEIELFLKSRDYWGITSQLLMLAEEAGELTVAALHLGRNNKDKDQAWENLAEEIADVEFMVAEFKYYFPDLQKKIDRFRAEKVKRLDNLLIVADKQTEKKP